MLVYNIPNYTQTHISYLVIWNFQDTGMGVFRDTLFSRVCGNILSFTTSSKISRFSPNIRFEYWIWKKYLAILCRLKYPGCQRLLFFFCERSERATRQSRVNEARSAEKKITVSLAFWTSDAIDILSYNTSTGLWNHSLLRRHSFGTSCTPPQRWGGVRDEPKECLRRRLLEPGCVLKE